MPTFTVTPAYGRDYKSRQAAVDAWHEGKDFSIASIDGTPAGGYMSVRDTNDADTIRIRYRKLTNVVEISGGGLISPI